MIERKTWTYGTGIRNRDYLKRDQSFDDLTKEIQLALCDATPSTVRFRMEPTSGKYDGHDPLLKRLQCTRPTWWIELDQQLLDKFFNGQMGIRAQYYVSSYHGLLANQMLLSALVDPLVELAAAIEPTIDRKLLRLSLSQPSAKAWISERDLAGKKIIHTSDLELSEEEIQNDWLDLARDVKNGKHPDSYQLYSASINGVHAPISDQLEVKGAWLTGLDRCEYVTPGKRDRHCQLFMFGFT